MKPTSQSALLISAVLAGLQVLNGGAAIGNVFGEKASGLIALIVGAIQVGYHTYNQTTQVVPVAAVAAVKDNDGTVVAGPAAAQANGTAVQVAASS